VKIDKSSSTLPLTTSTNGKARSPQAKTTESTPDNTPASSTSVNLGSTSAQLRSMSSSAANVSPINSSKVAEIKLAISEGRFQVNSGAVADSLIRSVADLISSHKA
jgi:negative regulator of flagellin synthesis FlgM